MKWCFSNNSPENTNEFVTTSELFIAEHASHPGRNVPGITSSSPAARTEIYGRSGFVLYANKPLGGIQKHAANYGDLNQSFKLLMLTVIGFLLYLT